ncbi:venom serine carboxypeptidase-like [Sitophilus oryzae]|uniref:Carboxypeptidase n=1 Tax=Sitophilus oryzae TaxID=7048 RepID=A0A6J2X1A1_SITOR|nr:venom serine carboxypeptidase-like [Sitophilus oryzae]XP_030744974.1 venom serine carboxypeptidase-like [Sitophilus oryzae]
MILLTLFLLYHVFQESSGAFPNFYTKIYSEQISGDSGEPLILTPLIEQNKIQEAQNISRVYFNGFKNVTSYSGYFTVDKTFNSNMFFWYFPAVTDSAHAPVVLWLQGGPGASSLIGLFAENGPFSVKNKHGLRLRKYSWTENHNVLYIDNPVGTGFSFTNGGYAKTETKVGEDLYTALIQFFTLFPELQKNEFFVTGESYAGKYVPAVSYVIHQRNAGAKLQINLQGLSIGNGLSDPEHQLKYGDYLYQLGLIDANAKKTVQDYEQQGINYIQNRQYDKAFQIFDELLNGDTNNHTSLFKNITGFDNYFNFLYPIDPLDIDLRNMAKYLQRSDIRAAIHVGNTSFSTETEVVEKNLMFDVMQSIAPWISDLLNNYRVLIYNGQLDIIVAYPLTENYLQNLNFAGADEYKTAKRYQWYVGSDIAGYVKQAGKLTEVLVRDAGHMVPADQPLWAWDMISRFTRNKPFHRQI